MPILPPPDDDYRGSPLAIWFLWFQIAVNAFRGCVHVFWADSGANRIAGIRSSTTRRRSSACSPRLASISWRGA